MVIFTGIASFVYIYNDFSDLEYDKIPESPASSIWPSKEKKRNLAFHWFASIKSCRLFFLEQFIRVKLGIDSCLLAGKYGLLQFKLEETQCFRNLSSRNWVPNTIRLWLFFRRNSLLLLGNHDVNVIGVIYVEY